METESPSSNDVSDVANAAAQPTPKPCIFNSLHAVVRDMNCRICLTDHRGRRFLKDFFVAEAPAVRRYGVWAYSASGASQLVVWSATKGRGPNGNRVRSGWGNPANAQKIADRLNEVANAWCAQYGPPPKAKKKPEKNRR